MEGDRQGLETAVRPQFVEDVLNVIANRGRTDTEAIGDGPRGFTGTQVLQNVTLARAQRQVGRDFRERIGKGEIHRASSGKVLRRRENQLQLIDQDANLGLIRDVAEEMDESEPVRFPGWHGQRTHV